VNTKFIRHNVSPCAVREVAQRVTTQSERMHTQDYQICFGANYLTATVKHLIWQKHVFFQRGQNYYLRGEVWTNERGNGLGRQEELSLAPRDYRVLRGSC